MYVGNHHHVGKFKNHWNALILILNDIEALKGKSPTEKGGVLVVCKGLLVDFRRRKLMIDVGELNYHE